MAKHFSHPRPSLWSPLRWLAVGLVILGAVLGTRPDNQSEPNSVQAVAPAAERKKQPTQPAASVANAQDTRNCYDLSQESKTYPSTARSNTNHSPSILALTQGKLMMAWFGGSREGARDVAIWASTFSLGAWSEPVALMSTDRMIRSTGQYFQKLGNPVLYADGEQMNLWFVAVSLGGWGGSRIAHMRSFDQGKTWSAPKLLVSSPFINVSTLVRANPVPVSALKVAAQSKAVDAQFLLPAYFELTHKYPVLMRLSATGDLLDRYPFGGLTGLLQPSIVADANGLTAYMRRGLAISTAQVFRSHSSDAGLTWSGSQAIGVPNGDASVAAFSDRQHHWLAANLSADNRHAMALYQLSPSSLTSSPPSAEVSAATHPIVIDQDTRNDTYREYSYPNWAQASDGSLHLVYTADGRKTIRHRMWPAASHCKP